MRVRGVRVGEREVVRGGVHERASVRAILRSNRYNRETRLKLLAFKREAVAHYPMLYRFERMILQHARDDDANHDALYEDTRNDARRGVNESAGNNFMCLRTDTTGRDV